MTDNPTPSPADDAPLAGQPPLVPQPQADRIRHYARRLTGLGVAAGALIVAGAALLKDAVDSGDSSDYLFGSLLVAFGIAQGIHARVRYGQLCRYLKTGSGSKYEDLLNAAERDADPAGG